MAPGMSLDTISASSRSTLAPLPPVLYHGLTAVAILGFISFVSSTGLFLFIGSRLVQWRFRGGKSKPHNQFIILIFNLLLADIQQSIAFLINTQWIKDNAITVGTTSCWAQGWFISTGDLASGVWCSAIGIHTFASVLFSYRLRPVAFYCTIASLWAFVYGCAIIGIGMHPHDLYVRAGAWCWVDAKLIAARLWLHYFWIFVAEFGTITIYACLYIGLVMRLRSHHYTPAAAIHAKQVARLMALYPAVYVCCTLPLASARMMSIAGRQPSYGRLCLAGAMITSNGWLDVLVYTLTRRISLFSSEPPVENIGVEQFTVPFFGNSGTGRFGTVTTIEGPAVQPATRDRKRSGFHHYTPSSGRPSGAGSRASWPESLEDLVVGKHVVRTDRTFEVRNDPLELVDIEALDKVKIMEARAVHVTHSRGPSKESASLDFMSKPEGYDSP